MLDLRLAEPADIPELHALIERAYRGDTARQGWTHEADLLGGQRTDGAALRAKLGDPSHHLLLHDNGEALDACVSLTVKPGRLIYIGLVTVDPRLQGSGIGSALLAGAEHYAAGKLQATKAEMTVIAQRRELIAWYERRGYALTVERRPFPYGDERFGLPNRPDLEFVVLEKRL